MYRRGEQVCKIWAKQNKPSNQPLSPQEESGAHTHDDESRTTVTDKTREENLGCKNNNRCRFDQSMCDILGRIIILKVFSHQLQPDFTVTVPGSIPAPNMFIVSANQIADNAASQAYQSYTTGGIGVIDHGSHLHYPPFSPKWCFSFEGNLTNKGATKVFYDRLDDELILRLQLRTKQGLFFRLQNQNALHTDFIGDDTLYRQLVKMVAMCWTRCIYRQPDIARMLWKRWRTLEQNQSVIDNIPLELPKNWKEIPTIYNNIIRACPFCQPTLDIRSKIGNLEHLHLYCTSQYLHEARVHCNEKLERAIFNLYNFAS